MPSVRISVPRETAERETRVAAIPETVAKLRAIGHTVLVESGAGAGASHSDDAYREAGATIAPDYASCVREAEAVLRVREPSEAEIAALPEGCALLGLLGRGEDAARMGIPFASGRTVLGNTANGQVRGYSVTLASVQVGDIVLANIPATVLDVSRAQLEDVLIGMSFLKQVEMRRTGNRLELQESNY